LNIIANPDVNFQATYFREAVKIPDRDIAVFSTSAVDLFASALGAFILLVMLLFPFYNHSNPDEAYAKTQNAMQQRSLASGKLEDKLAQRDQLQQELMQATAANQGIETSISRLKKRLADSKRQLASLPPVIAEPVSTVNPEPEPKAITHGVEFSILGLATHAKSFVILIDMSGSMTNYQDLMIKTVLDILKPLDESNQFAIIGYQGNPQPVLWTFPGANKLAKATKENLEQATIFARSLVHRFVGSTPTNYALQAALQYPASSIILMSDGEPNTQPGFILQEITRMNQLKQTEIHTVAIGDYTHNRNLVLFLQTLARLNNGDFVGVSS
jgi:hypothetical protein